MKQSHAILLLAGLTLLAYAPVMTGHFIWDDDDYVVNNANLRSADGLARIWIDPRSSPQYYPLVHSSFWIEYHLWGASAPGYHIVNILLHALGAILLWRVLVFLEIPGALIAACLFAVHPINAESVAWITERKNVLCAVFYFASALMYLRFDRSRSRRDYAIAIVLFIAAMFSKTVACSLPAALLLILWWKRGTITRLDWLALAPMFLVGLILAYLTVTLEVDWVRARGPEWDLRLIDRLLIASRAIWFYLTTLILPFNLSFVYPKWPIHPRLAWQWGFVIGVAVALFALWQMRGRWGRGPLVAALIFAGTLLPALGFFNIYPMRYTFVADHYTYLATASMFALAACGLAIFPRPLSIGVIALLLVLTMLRSSVFRDLEPLWRDTLSKNPDSWMVNLNLAKALNPREDKTESWRYFARQVQLAPNLAETHLNYAGSLVQQRQLDRAIEEYAEAIRIGGDVAPQAYFSRGRVYLDQNKLAEAAADFQRAIDLKPNYAQAHNQLGSVYIRGNQLDAAAEEFKSALHLDPDLAEAHINLAAVLARQGNLIEATDEFERGVQIDPSLARFRTRVLNSAPGRE